MLTLNNINDRVKKISVMTSDSECAHIYEDELYIDFIRHVSEHSKDRQLKKLAIAVLEAHKLGYARWYA